MKDGEDQTTREEHKTEYEEFLKQKRVLENLLKQMNDGYVKKEEPQ